MSLRLACSGGRPRLPPGSSGPSTAHCASVRSARLVTAKVATRSPCRWSSLSLTHLPETSSVPGQRHAGLGQLKPLSPLLKHALGLSWRFTGGEQLVCGIDHGWPAVLGADPAAEPELRPAVDACD